MTKRELTVKSVVEKFDNITMLNKGNLERKISYPSLTRTGIELASSTSSVHDKLGSIVLWGNSEQIFLKALTATQRREAIRRVVRLDPPAIMLTKSFEDVNIVLNVLKTSKIPVLKSSFSTNETYFLVSPYIAKSLSPSRTVHGTLVNIFGVGVLLMGESGIGKSEIALELVKKGHLFVGDDAIDIVYFAGQVFGEPNLVANKFIEIRGLGILDISRMFGVEKIAKSTQVEIVVNLVKWDKVPGHEFERVGNDNQYVQFENAKLLSYTLPITPGRKISDIVETVVIDFKLKSEGYNSAKEFLDNYEKALAKGVK